MARRRRVTLLFYVTLHRQVRGDTRENGTIWLNCV